MKTLFLLFTILFSIETWSRPTLRCASVYKEKKGQNIKVPTRKETREALAKLDWKIRPLDYKDDPHANFEWIPMRDGMDIWGSYVCQGLSCGQRVSAQRDRNGRVYCPHCRKPHTTESFDNVFFEKEIDGVTHVRSSDLRVPGPRNPLIQCPTCKASNTEYPIGEPETPRMMCVYCDSPLGKQVGDRTALIHTTNPDGTSDNLHLVALPEDVGFQVNNALLAERVNIVLLNKARGELIRQMNIPDSVPVTEIDRMLMIIFEKCAEKAVQNGELDMGFVTEQFAPLYKTYQSETPIVSEGPVIVQTPVKAFDKNGKEVTSAVTIKKITQVQEQIQPKMLVAFGAATLIGSGLAVWGYQPVIYEGVVTEIHGNSIIMTFKDGEKQFTVTSVLDANVNVAVGDLVWLHARKLIGKHKGLEFESGSVQEQIRPDSR